MRISQSLQLFSNFVRVWIDSKEHFFDESSSIWIKQLDQLMTTDGLEDARREGLLLIKARQLSIDDQLQLSTVVDELQCWFSRRKD